MAGLAKELFGVGEDGAASSGFVKGGSDVNKGASSNVRCGGTSRELWLLNNFSAGEGVSDVNQSPAPIFPTFPILKEKPATRIKFEQKYVPTLSRVDIQQWVPKLASDIVQNPLEQFSRFNKQPKFFKYTDREYNDYIASLPPPPVVTTLETPDKRPKPAASPMKAVKGEKKNIAGAWNRHDTDILFDLIARFDLRFIVIHDRWPPECMPRSVDELKDRYYSIAKKLYEVRNRLQRAAVAGTGSGSAGVASQPITGALQKQAQALISNPFDIEYELARKKQLEEQFKVDKNVLRADEELVQKAKQIEAKLKRIGKERLRLQKLLKISPEALAAASEAAAKSANFSLSSRMGVSKGSRLSTGAKLDLETAPGLPSKLFPHRKAQVGAFARSSFIYTPVTQSTKVAKKLDVHLDILGVPLRPMATGPLVDVFDVLRLELLTFLELHRVVTRKEEETHALRIKIAKVKGVSAPEAPKGVSLSHKKRKQEDYYFFDKPRSALPPTVLALLPPESPQITFKSDPAAPPPLPSTSSQPSTTTDPIAPTKRRRRA